MRFLLKCEDIDSFLAFYSSFKRILYKLKKSKSITVSDDVFLQSYFAKVIQMTELRHKVKKLLKGGKESHMAILDMVHSDFNAQLTNESMLDEAKTSGILRQSGENYPFRS